MSAEGICCELDSSGSAEAAEAASLGRIHQLRLTSEMGVGTYLRASIGTIVPNSLGSREGIGIMVSRLEVSGMAMAASWVVTRDSRTISRSASTSFETGRFVAEPTEAPA